MNDRYKIENVSINITDLDDATQKIIEKAKSKSPGYVCVTNVRALYIGNHDNDYCRILNNSFLTVPDGKPLEWYAHVAGFKSVKKTSGPDLFEKICQLTENKNYTHFLYGSTPEIVSKMKENVTKKYPKIKIIGAVSPPFATAQELADEDIIHEINKLEPTFVWVGLGAPKQEIFMDLIANRIRTSILIGIGLVFEYQAGTVLRAPKWMQKSGLEWFYRHLQQPNLINRNNYARNFSIIALILKAFLNKIKSKNSEAIILL
jgi:N-acetylglucosaminyldiphosphoundecaprenol N-acetyl-beta-D-mannosaminyltransferase